MRLAVQLYTLRDLLEDDLTRTLSAVREIGYECVETAGLHGRTPEEFRSELDQAGLTAVSCHVGLTEVETHLDHEVRTATELGAQWLVVPWLAADDYSAGWDKVAGRLERVADLALASGMQFAYHNHDFEFANDGFTTLWDTAAETLEAELDLYWVQVAGHDPSQWLRALAGRVPLAHFKDGKNGAFTPVGEGTLPWAEIIESAKLAGVQYAIVELDECPRDPLACIEASFEFLRDSGVPA